jgi:hypothetical protein
MADSKGLSPLAEVWEKPQKNFADMPPQEIALSYKNISISPQNILVFVWNVRNILCFSYKSIFDNISLIFVLTYYKTNF